MRTIYEKLKIKTPIINSWLLVAIFFMMPIKASFVNILSFLLLLLWLVEGDFKTKISLLRNNRVFWIFWSYFWILVIGLGWSENISWGLNMVGRSIYFLLFPLYLTVVRSEHMKLYITAFIASVTVSEVLSYYNWFQLHYFTQLPQGIRSGEGWEIAPFVNHIMYNPILAFGAYLVGHSLLFDSMSKAKRLFFVLFLLTMSANMFISGGRGGQVGFLAMMGLLAFQYFVKRKILAIVSSIAAVTIFFVFSYQTSELFKERVDTAIYEFKNYDRDFNTSVGLRIYYAINTARVFATSPIFGVGTGDLPAEYDKINQKYTPQLGGSFNPHNQYLMTLSTTGIIGGVILLALLLYPPYLARDINDEYSRLRVALPFLFAVICFSESYLWRSNTSLMFVLFSAILYANLNRPTQFIEKN